MIDNRRTTSSMSPTKTSRYRVNVWRTRMWRHRPGHVTDSSTEYSEQGYVVTYVDNDHYRFIVDSGECAGGMHMMEVQDDSIDGGPAPKRDSNSVQ